MRSEFEKAFKKEYPHADYLACLKFDEVENQYKPINEEVEPPDVNFWVCVGVNTGWWAWQYRQTEVDELQRRNQMLNDNIKEQGQKLVYQNEVIETQAEKLIDLRDEKAELQKRVDAVKRLAQTLWEKSEEKHQQGKVWESKTLGECADEILDVLEQALKGKSNESST